MFENAKILQANIPFHNSMTFGLQANNFFMPLLCGFVCAYDPAAPGSNPKHTITIFSICIIEIVMRKGRK